jgi:hypothetical protein
MHLHPVDEAFLAVEKTKTEHLHHGVPDDSEKGADAILRVIRAGALEFLSRPVTGTDLASALK